MMGCSDDSEAKRSDSLNGRKLRPLMPRPTTSIPANNTYSVVANPSYCSLLHNPNLSTMNEHLAATEEQSKPDSNTVPSVTSRWSPTPQQLHALEEMYRSGTRTPTADQIQQIAGKLRRFGRIEGKNVFYWFQNHKARERQKRSRLPNSYSEEQICDIESLERKESGLSRTGFEVALAKKRATSSNCSTLSQESESIRRAVVSESSTEAWIQFEERELQRRRRSTQTKQRQLMKPSSSTPPINFMNTVTSTALSPEALVKIDPKLSSTHKFEDESCRETQMLQLFPLWSDDPSVHNVENKDTEVPMAAIDTSFTPNQFFEFFPLKN